MNKKYEIEYDLNDNPVVVSFEADFDKEDHGIGGYEFWGARCNDVNWVCVCSNVNIHSVVDEDGKDLLPTLSKADLSKIEDAASEYADENAPEVEDYDSDYEDGRPDPRDDYPDYD